jgi:regulatory protein
MKTEAPGAELSELEQPDSKQPLSASFRQPGSGGREQSDFQKLLAYALKALARREHSTVELRRKLDSYLDRQSDRARSADELSPGSSRGGAEDVISRVIDALVLDGSLSDERFAAEFVRSRVLKGYGPIRIRMDLLERGVPDRLAEDELTRPSEFWQQQAAEVCVRKFGDPQALDAQAASDRLSLDLEEASPAEIRQLMKDRKEAAQRRWNRCARFLSQRGFPADLIYQTLDGRLLD